MFQANAVRILGLAASARFPLLRRVPDQENPQLATVSGYNEPSRPLLETLAFCALILSYAVSNH